jgi:uncharacterized protein YbjT (DUF2867 family)
LLLVIGGTGFLGGKVVEQLLERQYPIRLLTRGAGDWKTSNLSQYRKRGIEVVVGPLEDDEVLSRAVEGATCIVNISGSFRLVADRRDSPYEYLNVTLVEKLLYLCREFGVQRFVHVSCLGSRLESDSHYLSTKSEGEALLSNSELYWTILRPSYMFGERFPFLEMLKPLITFKPFLTVVGSTCTKGLSSSLNNNNMYIVIEFSKAWDLDLTGRKHTLQLVQFLWALKD